MSTMTEEMKENSPQGEYCDLRDDMKPHAIDAIQMRTVENTEDLPWTEDEMLARFSVVRYHVGWLGMGFVQYGVNPRLSSLLRALGKEIATLQGIESRVYREALTARQVKHVIEGAKEEMA